MSSPWCLGVFHTDGSRGNGAQGPDAKYLTFELMSDTSSTCCRFGAHPRLRFGCKPRLLNKSGNNLINVNAKSVGQN